MKHNGFLVALFTGLLCLPFLSFGEKDIPALRQKAEQGDANAQYNLGVYYYNGDGVPRDYKESVKWFRLAAEQGDAEAQYNLGLCYTAGEDVDDEDYKQAVKWYRKAAEQGYADAQNDLGELYAYGQGVAQDYPEAVKWFRLAAEQGFAPAQDNLGRSYARGKGVPQDYKEAEKWLLLATEQGGAEAQYKMGVRYYNGDGIPQDYEKAVKWYHKAAEQGYAKAQRELGKAYDKGNGVPKDNTQAARWFRLAAEQGDAVAQFNLGRAYFKGEGVQKDYKKAAKWFLFTPEKLFSLGLLVLVWLIWNVVPMIVGIFLGIFKMWGGKKPLESTATRPARYIDNNDGTVTDNMTGLMWTKNANHGQMNWADAVAYCDKFVFAGHSDWRLPSVAADGGTAELDTLFAAGGNRSGAWEGCVGTPFTGVQDSRYWSGSSLSYFIGDAWSVAMGCGFAGSEDTDNDYFVWPVRGGQ